MKLLLKLVISYPTVLSVLLFNNLKLGTNLLLVSQPGRAVIIA